MKNTRVLCFNLLLASVLGFSQEKDTPRMFDTGNDFLSVCEHPKDAGDGNACTYYVFGVADGIAFTQPSDKPILCLDPHATIVQERNIAIHFMRTHPEKTHTATAALIFDALRDAFPCHSVK